MNFLLGSSPVTSQLHHVSRHSLACGVFRLNPPLVMHSMKPRSWSSMNARAAVPRAMLHRSEARRIEAEPAVVSAVVAPCDFEKHRTGLATQ